MNTILLDVWLYGELKAYAGEASQVGYANIQARLPEGSTVAGLLAFLQMPSEKRGITFINGKLSAMPGLQPDLEHTLQDADRVSFFDLHSMWPFQYRSGAAMVNELKDALEQDGGGIHHAYGPSKDHS